VDEAPTADTTSPANGSTVAGTETIQVNATDDRDGAGTLTVEVSIDGGAFQAATYNAGNDRYEYSWDTTLETDGAHTIDARATDSAAQTTNASQISVTVDNSVSGSGTIKGTVSNSQNGRGLGGATVQAAPGGESGATNNGGKYSIDVSAGDHTVSVVAGGSNCSPASQPVSVADGQTVSGIDFTCDP
jgi:hypothetical protein